MTIEIARKTLLMFRQARGAAGVLKLATPQVLQQIDERIRQIEALIAEAKRTGSGQAVQQLGAELSRMRETFDALLNNKGLKVSSRTWEALVKRAAKVVAITRQGTELRLKRVPATDEWSVVVYVNGKRDEDQTYYTDDKADAVATMADMQRRLDAGDMVDKSKTAAAPPEQAEANPKSNLWAKVFDHDSADDDIVHEMVELYIPNDSQIHNQYMAFIKNFALKMARGVFDKALAAKGAMHLVDAAAQKYFREFADPKASRGIAWHQVFPMALRRRMAEIIAANMQAEIERGDYDLDSLLPKKYRGFKPQAAEQVAPKGQPVEARKKMAGGFVVKNEAGSYQARPGGDSSYTKDIGDAREFATREDAEEACDGFSETVVVLPVEVGKTAASGGYTDCACPDCFEIAIGKRGKAMCSDCEDAGCDGEGECQAEGAYGGMDSEAKKVGKTASKKTAAPFDIGGPGDPPDDQGPPDDEQGIPDDSDEPEEEDEPEDLGKPSITVMMPDGRRDVVYLYTNDVAEAEADTDIDWSIDDDAAEAEQANDPNLVRDLERQGYSVDDSEWKEPQTWRDRPDADWVKEYDSTLASIADEIIAGIKSGDIEYISDRVHEDVDGNHYIIYTAEANRVLNHSSNSDAARDSMGDEADDYTTEQLAYFAMAQDLYEVLNEKLDEFGVDVNDDVDAIKEALNGGPADEIDEPAGEPVAAPPPKGARRKRASGDAFTRQYMETALWSTDDNSDESGGQPLDKTYGVDDIADETWTKMQSDCTAFMQDNADDIASDPGQAGHDFWLTRNGHGAGFWDGDWPEDVGKRLTDASKAYGEVDLYVGDDGLIHQG